MERHARRPRPRIDALALGLVAVLLGAFGLRVWGIGHGLPFSYNIDEEGHFVPVAIGFFGHGFNPRYFLNPPGFTELLYAVYAVWFGGREAVAKAYVDDPSQVFLIARVTVALLGTVSVWLLHLLGSRLFDRRVGLLAAAIGAVAFLPVFYSHLALNDVPSMFPATLALLCAALILKGSGRAGGLGWLLLGGVAVGLAAGTKYTAGIVLLPLATAVLIRTREERAGVAHALAALALAGLATAVGFLIANPHALLSFSEFRAGVGRQRELAGGDELAKLGLTQENGVLYYLWAFTWGLGWIPALLALGGAVLSLFKERRIALLLLPTVVVYLVYMGTQDRYFGRWLLPLFPIACVLAAWFAIWLIELAAARWPRAARPVAIVAVIAILAQGLVYVIHNDRVLSRPDTRGLAHDWMVENIPAGTKVMLEPIVPARWSEDPNRADPATASGKRWELWDTARASVDDFGRRVPSSRFVKVDKYQRVLYPELLDEYEAAGFCWVVIGSHQRDRALAQPGEVPGALAYYDALAQRGEEVARFSPYKEGADPPTFNFDWAFDYYPLAYERPGPEIVIYRLSGGGCS
ncbi:glycosyltransferase family 39 protein [Conexibacter stalactiti]|uniref:Glycosyltransferase family 39 protein n=1 Tax=Conexibacter stalactiti TaxID=1940611 RepID=A0ABU4HZD3_9ACTN|nr:glycosyltransferase family 39 protein [Conexibacter stalactiti]MDW5598274.1 glycosyltransferase family 39 protein [Conexibacter stalactiti]MEC5038916.1 glycosyltransferase family 39 protein [Conexibacter stalactiti]